jgi:hypothetical protein
VATEPQPRNPYIVGLGVVGGIAGVIALILAWVGDSARRGLISLDPYAEFPDPAAIAPLFAWADVLGLVAIVAIAGALIIAGVRWTPKVSVTNEPPLRLDGTLYPPGGLTAAERRLLDGDETR